MNKAAFIFVVLSIILAECSASWAEVSEYYQMKAHFMNDTEVINFGFFHWRFAGVNDHAQVTYIHSSQLGNIAGFDVGGGLWFFDIGAVVGVDTGNSKNREIHPTAAIYPELFFPIWGERDYFMDLNARYYFTTDGRGLATVGVGFTWAK